MEYKLSEKQFNQLKDKGFAINFSQNELLNIMQEKQLILIKESKSKFSKEEMGKIGNHLKSIRRDTGLSRVEFGKQISVGGVSIPESAIKDWEEGNTLIPEKELRVYLKKFGNDTLLSKIYTKPNSKKATIISNKNISQEMKDFIIKKGLGKQQFIALFERRHTPQTIISWLRGRKQPKYDNENEIKKILKFKQNDIERILNKKTSGYSIGKRIKELVELNNITCTQLAEVLNTNSSRVSQICNGYLLMTDDEYQTVADFFDTTVEYLKTGKE